MYRQKNNYLIRGLINYFVVIRLTFEPETSANLTKYQKA